MYAFAPSAGAMLADWGADVVKVVPVAAADPMAHPDIIAGLPRTANPVAFMWAITNRGKRAIGLDLATDEGQYALHRLVKGADVFLTNLLPDARQRFRLDVGDLQTVKPDLIYARASGHGQRGPESGTGGFDHTDFWARTGIAHSAGQVSDEFAPQPGPALGDLTAGGFLAGAIAAALFRRERTGRGAVVDVSLLSAGMYVFSPAIVASTLYSVDTIPRFRHADQRNALVAGYRTKDDRIIYLSGVRTDSGFSELCEAIAEPALADDPRFLNWKLRSQHARECIAALDVIFARRTLDEWLPALAGLTSPWTVVRSAREASNDAQAHANGYLVNTVVDGVDLQLVASPAQFDETPPELAEPPAHGEHTDEILAALGYSWDEVVEMKLRGSVL